jgi:glucose 1-dehydrogenase
MEANSMKVLEGKSAIVTGAARGIGRACAIALAQAGANVAVNDIGPAAAVDEVVRECQSHGVQARSAIADMGDQQQVERMVAESIAEFGQLDIGISNAAFSERELFYKADMAGFEKTIQVSMWGPFYLVRALALPMIQRGQGGSIVVVSSTHAHRPIPGAMAYNMAKAASDQMARTAATELCSHRIRVNIIHPGWVDTPGERKFFSEEKLQQLGAGLPWGRLARPDEVARAAVFLCDPASDYLNGLTLPVDGGIELPVNQMHRLEQPMM